jgi:GNAT superfamily N-acetyltransferase
VLGVLATQVFLDTYATAGIRAVLAREVLGTFSTQALQQALADPSADLQLAEVQDHVVGYQHTVLGAAHDRVRAQWPTAVQAELLRLYVQEPFTGCGIGKALLRTSEAAARRRGAHVLWLTPWVHNRRALRFYADQGYRDLGATVFRMEEETHENRVVCKLL